MNLRKNLDTTQENAKVFGINNSIARKNKINTLAFINRTFFPKITMSNQNY